MASSEQSCDVQCDITTATIANATSKTVLQSTVATNKTRRFYFAKIVTTTGTGAQAKSICTFIPTAATNVDDTGKEFSVADVAPTTVNFTYNPFI